MTEKQTKKAGAKAPAKKKSFDPKSLTAEEQALVVEEYLGAHPKHFLYEGLKIKLNVYEVKNFNGWKQDVQY